MPTASFEDDLVVRPLTSRDLSKVRDLHSKLLPVQYPASFFIQLLLIPTRACFVAYTKAQPSVPVGFISAAIQQPVSTLQSCFTTDTDSAGDSPCVSAGRRDKTFADLARARLEILTLGVLPSHQQRGLARRLVQRVVDALRESRATNSVEDIPIYANVATSNTQALIFYKRIGLEVSPHIIRNFYRTLSYGSKDAYIVGGFII